MTVIFALIALLVACEARSSRGKVRYHQPTKKETRAARIALTQARTPGFERNVWMYANRDEVTGEFIHAVETVKEYHAERRALVDA